MTLFSYFSQPDRHVLFPGQGYPKAGGEHAQVGDGHLPGVDDLHPPGPLLLEIAEAGPAKAVVVDFVLPLVGGRIGDCYHVTKQKMAPEGSHFLCMQKVYLFAKL